MPGRFHFACYLWSMFGTMLINALMVLRGRSYTRLLGNFLGLVLVLTGQVRSAAAHSQRVESIEVAQQ